MDHRYLLDALFKRWDRRGAIPKDDKEALLALPWTHRVFGRDAYLVREGEPTTSCMLLVSGFAFRQKLVDSGARPIVSFHIPGEFLDIQNCLLETADHNVQALSRISTAVIAKAPLLELMERRPNIRKALWTDSLSEASVFREWVVNVGRRDARQRIAHLLCELAARLRSAGLVNGEMYEFPLTQEQIADATGLTSVHTNRTLQTLRKDRLISLNNGKMSVLDWDGLADAGDFSERYLHHNA